MVAALVGSSVLDGLVWRMKIILPAVEAFGVVAAMMEEVTMGIMLLRLLQAFLRGSASGIITMMEVDKKVEVVAEKAVTSFLAGMTTLIKVAPTSTHQPSQRATLS
mgnify:CR=1 FL=1